MNEPKRLFSVGEVADEAGAAPSVIKDIAADLGLGEVVASRLILTAEEKEDVLAELEEEE